MEKTQIILFSKSLNLLEEVPLEHRRSFISLEDDDLLYRKASGATIVTNHNEKVHKLYELGAAHVFQGPDFWGDLKSFFEDDHLDKFLNKNFPHFEGDIRRRFSTQIQGHKRAGLPILLTGESGCGKTHLAKLIHKYTLGRKPFIARNLCEISGNLIESELFGHKKGSFTGATADKIGLLECVNGGTLFLDEISGLSLELQIKLLKVIEEKSFTPIGANKPIKVDFNLITATCDDLEELVKNKLMRPDFLARINALKWHMSPIRQSPHEIDHYLELFQKDFKRQLYFTNEAKDLMKTYSWPGNIRELKNYYLLLQTQKTSVIRGFKKVRDSQSSVSCKNGLPELIEEVENSVFKRSYAKYDGRPNKICQELKISKSVFYRLAQNITSKTITQAS